MGATCSTLKTDSAYRMGDIWKLDNLKKRSLAANFSLFGLNNVRDFFYKGHDIYISASNVDFKQACGFNGD